MFLTALALVVLNVCSNSSIVIVVALLLSSYSLCSFHSVGVGVVVVPIADPPTVKVDCYVFGIISAFCPSCLWQGHGHHCHHLVIVIAAIVLLSSH
jgi:hypothetical protein